MHFLFFLLSSVLFAQDPSGMQWKAQYYERDLKTNTLKGRGNAYFKQGNQEVWADEIEVNFNTNWAFANGNAHFYDGTNDIFCERGNYSLSGNEAILEDATVISGQMVISGAQIRKLSKTQFEMDEGIYTNCNTDAIRNKSAATCAFDWKVYGKHFSVTMEGYAHIYDAIVYTKDVPVFYVPYYMAPAKTKRASGLLTLKALTGTKNIGSGVGWPFFWALGSWHDVTIDPMYYSKAGMHLGLNYNYIYSRANFGTANFYGTQWKYSPDRTQPSVAGHRNNMLGEWAVDIHNQYSLGGRAKSRQTLTMVSDPYYTIDFDRDLGSLADKSNLRSQFSASFPSDNYLATGAVTHFQSLVMPSDSGVDHGSVTQLPTLGFSQKSEPSFLKFISYEVDTKFSNFYRPGDHYDKVPANRTDPVPYPGPFSGNDYVRVGQRLMLEPRATVNVPLASGFQLQPTFKAGTLVYHFDVPNSQAASQEYVDAELPFSMYLARNYKTGISGLEKIRHIFQPRLIYANALYRSPTPKHPFFSQYSLSKPDKFNNPGFDITDQVTSFEYLQFELINRFLREVGASNERFLNITLSNQFNSRVSDSDPRFRSRIGPVLLTVDFAIAPIAVQLQGSYAIEKVGPYQSETSGSISYSSPQGDKFTLNGLYRVQDNPLNNVHKYNLSFAKTLPVFVDFSGGVEYDARAGKPGNYSVGLLFASKPVTCWHLLVSYSKNINTGEVGTHFDFGFEFGGPVGMSSASTGI